MQKKMIIRFSTIAVSTFLLFFHMHSCAVTAYIPQALRNCITVVHEMAKQTNNVHNNLTELYSMIVENRILISDTVMRKALDEAFHVLKNGSKFVRNRDQTESVKRYLQEYLNSLDDTSALLSLNGSDVQRTSFPISSVAHSAPESSRDIDIMCLSSMLTSVDNMQLCGINDSIKQTRLFDHNIFFNPNAMTNVLYNAPNVIFGTGVSSPIINAWAIAPSTMVQSPINMQLSIPGALLLERAEMLDLHFLVKKQGAGHHRKARVAVNVKYMGQYEDFNIFSPVPTFTYVEQSNDFDVFEPLSEYEVRHICVTVPLQKTLIKKCNFIIMSVTRIDPSSGIEYEEDIYLAAAILRYQLI